MKMSDTISALAGALSKAQGMIDDASKGSDNPHFKSRYADLASVRAAIREPLAVNDLAILQFSRAIQDGVEVETMLTHKSGEYFSEVLFMPVSKYDAQGIGSGITYARRYGIMGILCVASDDDDGNAAVTVGPAANPIKAPAVKAEAVVTPPELMEEGTVHAKQGMTALRLWHDELHKDDKDLISADARAVLKAIATGSDKARAKKASEQ